MSGTLTSMTMRCVLALACLAAGPLIARPANAAESASLVVAVHEATLQGDSVHWDTRLIDCTADPAERPDRLVTTAPLNRVGEAVRLAPPVFRDESVRIVVFRDPDLVFVPEDFLAAHRTCHGLEILLSAESPAEALRCLHRRGIELSPSALLMGRDPKIDTGLSGTLVRRQTRTQSLVVVIAWIFVAAIGALIVAHRRLRRRVRFESAEAILRADMPDF